jgi:hypothetical protein
MYTMNYWSSFCHSKRKVLCAHEIELSTKKCGKFKQSAVRGRLEGSRPMCAAKLVLCPCAQLAVVCRSTAHRGPLMVIAMPLSPGVHAGRRKGALQWSLCRTSCSGKLHRGSMSTSRINMMYWPAHFSWTQADTRHLLTFQSSEQRGGVKGGGHGPSIDDSVPNKAPFYSSTPNMY